MSEFTYKQIDDLNSWMRLSKRILMLYNDLCRNEFLYGKNSMEYKISRKSIESSLKKEEELIKKFSSSSELFQQALDYINDSSLGFSRIVTRNSNDFLKTIWEFLNFDTEVISIESIIVSKLKNKSMLELIDSELQYEKDSSKRDLLIYSKNYILTHDKSLEHWYFTGEEDKEFSLIHDDELLAKILGTSVEQYRLDIKRLINRDIVRSVGFYLKDEDEEEESFEMEVRALSRLLDDDDIAMLRTEIEESYAGINPSRMSFAINVLNDRNLNQNKRKVLNKNSQNN